VPDPKTKPKTAGESFDAWFNEYTKRDLDPHWIEKGEYLDKVDFEAIRKSDKKVLYDLWKESGQPYVKQMSADEFIRKGYIMDEESKEPRAFFKSSKRTLRPFDKEAGSFEFNVHPDAKDKLINYLGTSLFGEKMREYSPDTLNIQYGDKQDFIAELAHAEQFKSVADPVDKYLDSYIARQQVGEDVYDYKYLEDIPEYESRHKPDISYWSGRDLNARKTLSMEYEAHEMIEPKLKYKYDAGEQDYLKDLIGKGLIE